ncbi:MAG: LysE family translocator [Pseudomonadota bacterium]
MARSNSAHGERRSGQADLAGIGTAYGFRQGLRYLGGIVAGTTGVLLMIATRVTTPMPAHPTLVVVLTVIAGAYIVDLAWKNVTAPVRSRSDGIGAAPAFVTGFLLAIANLKALAAIGAVFSSRTVIPGHVAADAGAKLLALCLAIILANTAWLAFGAGFSQILSNPKIRRAANTIFAGMLLTSVAVLLV